MNLTTPANTHLQTDALQLAKNARLDAWLKR